MKIVNLVSYAFVLVLIQCKGKNNNEAITTNDGALSCEKNMPARFPVSVDTVDITAGEVTADGMVKIPAGEFMMGAADNEGRPDEYPQHKVKVNAFFMDATEVTNAQFEKFVDATGYVTTAEKKPDWEELKKQLPEGTAKPDESLLVAASLVFTNPGHPVSLNDASLWWNWKQGANWKHPQGPNSSIEGKGDYPVVQISWVDAVTYCKWAGKRLPTEAEWEWAIRGAQINKKYPWGDEDVESQKPKANTWQGNFPYQNTNWDKYYASAPVKSFAPNAFGLYDMAGNVWEWCSDWYRNDYYDQVTNDVLINPKGPANSYDPMEPTIPKKVVRGGSFLCNASYCKGYRVTSRMKTSPDTGLEHTGFRCVKDDAN